MELQKREEVFTMAGSLNEEMNILEEMTVSDVEQANVFTVGKTPFITLVCC